MGRAPKATAPLLCMRTPAYFTRQRHDSCHWSRRSGSFGRRIRSRAPTSGLCVGDFRSDLHPGDAGEKFVGYLGPGTRGTGVFSRAFTPYAELDRVATKGDARCRDARSVRDELAAAFRSD